LEDNIINEPFNEPLVREKIKKKKRLEDDIINEPYKQPLVGEKMKKKKTFADEPFNDLYILAYPYLVYTFKVIFAVLLGVAVMVVVLPALLGWSSTRSVPPIHSNEAQIQRPQTVTLNIGNSSNNFVAQRLELPVRNRLNEAASEVLYTQNSLIHLANLRGMMYGWSNMDNVKED